MRMERTFIIQVLLMLICWAAIVQSAPRIDPKRQVKLALNRKCKSEDPIGCIDIARTELIESGRSSPDRIDPNPYELALRQIMKFRDVIDDPDCDNYEFDDPLSFVRYSTVGHRRVPDPEDSLSPFDSLIHFVSLKRAEKCRDTYLQKFSYLYTHLPAELRELVEGFKYEELVEDKASMNGREYMEWLIDYKFNGYDEQNLADAVHYVRRLSSNDPGRGSPTRMYLKYLRQPCQAYNSYLERELAKQMRFDAEMFEGKTFYHLEEDRADTLIPLYQCMARTQFCKIFDRQLDFMERFNEEWRNQIIRERMGWA